MGQVLFLLLLLALFLGPAAAQTPLMTPSPSPEAVGTFYPDPDGLLDGVNQVCTVCRYFLDHCECARELFPTEPPFADFTPETFLNHPEWADLHIDPDLLRTSEPSSPRLEPEPEPEPSRAVSPHDLEQLSRNVTIVETAIPAWREDVYVPTSRQRLQVRASASRATPKRHQPVQDGFRCDECGHTFNRQCDLTRHQKLHLDRKERPHKCSFCDLSFHYPKDRDRHHDTHPEFTSSRGRLYCSMPGCNNTNGFRRKDNFRRHMKRQHNIVAA